MMTPDQINRAWELRAANKSYQAIGEALGVSAKQVRLTLHPYRRQRFSKPAPRDHKVRIQHVPQSVLDEREKTYQARMSENLTLGQVLFGDPLPGKSALDRRRK